MGSKCCGRENANWWGSWPSWCEERGALQQEGGAHSQPGGRSPFITRREGSIHNQEGGILSQPGGRSPFITRREGPIHNQKGGALHQDGGAIYNKGGCVHPQPEGRPIFSRELKENGLSNWPGRLWRLRTRMSWHNNQRSTLLYSPQNTSTAALSHCSMVAKRRWHKSF